MSSEPDRDLSWRKGPDKTHTHKHTHTYIHTYKHTHTLYARSSPQESFSITQTRTRPWQHKAGLLIKSCILTQTPRSVFHQRKLIKVQDTFNHPRDQWEALDLTGVLKEANLSCYLCLLSHIWRSPLTLRPERWLGNPELSGERVKTQQAFKVNRNSSFAL